MSRLDDWVFAVDFGTTNTVAAMGDVHGVRPLAVNGRTAMPSAVMLQERGGWLVGELAINAARRKLDWFEATPKSWIRHGTVFLGGRNVSVVDAVAAVLRFVAGEAQKQHGAGPPQRFVVTHPAGWADSRTEMLLEAADRATSRTWPKPEPLAEPVAAGQGVLRSDDVPSPARIVVLDLGGGTVDVATVDRDGDQLEVISIPDGIDEAGGEEFDVRLARLMTAEADEDGLYDKLAIADDPNDRLLALDIRVLARTVKEQLSVEPVVRVDVVVPGSEGPESRPVQVNRAQLEALIIGGGGGPPGLMEAVRLAVSARDDAPPGPPFTGVYLVGGSSRIPLLGRLLQQEIGRPPIDHGDPGTAVAEGAAAWALRTSDTGTGDGGTSEVTGTGGQTTGEDVFDRLRRLRILSRQSLRLLGALTVALVVGVAAWVILRPPPPSPPSPCGPGTVQNPDGTCTSIGAPDTLDPTDVGVGVRGCTTAGAADCGAAILSASRSVWPGIPADRCVARESRYGVDLYSAECDTTTLSYNVFWRKDSGSILSTLAGQMITPSLREFRLPDDPATLGTQVGGSRRTESGERFTCVWEYADYPVTLVLDGPNENATAALCNTMKFLDSATMKSVMTQR